MSTGPANFDRLAHSYQWLERLAFGRDLERARFAWLERLSGCRSILVLGEGDGRCAARLVRLAPGARLHCLDASAAMLARAKHRLRDTPARERVRFEQADLRSHDFVPREYDAVVTLFFLDCFAASDAAAIVQRVSEALTPAACWLYADFAMPNRPLAALRARIWLAVLYAFFRWETGIRTRELPAAESLIQAAGFAPIAARTLQAGLLRSVLFRRGGVEPATPPPPSLQRAAP